MIRSHRIAWTAVLATLALAATPSRGDTDSSPMVVFSKSGDSKPYFSEWRNSTWTPSSGTALTAVSANPDWVVVRNCPMRYETACATLESSKKVNVMFHNGTSWGSPTQICASVGAGYQRSVDTAYEQSSGDLLIAYWDTSLNKVGYRTYDGTTLSAQSTVDVTEGSTAMYVALYSKPGGDEIIMLTLHNNRHLNAVVWNGSSWGSVTAIDTGLSFKDQEDMALAYESLSGRALIVYTKNASWPPQYRTWNGSSWSAAADAPSFSATCQWLRLAADPTTNNILFGALYDWGGTQITEVNSWNGTSWGTQLQVESTFPDANSRRIDIAYEYGTGKGLVVYQEGTQTSLRYRTWNGSSWSSEQVGANIGDAARFIQLRTGTSSGEVFIACSDEGNDLEMARWNGSSMSATQQLTGALGGSSTTEQFMMTMSASRTTTPANIPYYTNFESGAGNEWNSGKTINNASYTRFSGQHRTSPLKLALNTTVGETYRLKFDFYAIDSWDGNSSSSGPDYFDVVSDSTQVFRETFTHEYPANGMSLAYTADQMGHYGYNGSYKDAIYKNVEVVFSATNTVTTLSFYGEFYGTITGADPNGFDDESWGIDNVSVDTSRFLDVSVAKGFNVTTSTTDASGAGLHWADVDNDGDLDCILTGNSSSRLALNNNAGASFTVTTFGGGTRSCQGALGDLNSDGSIDFYHRDLKLYQNNGSGSFTDAGNEGFSQPSTFQGMAAGDVNGDGLIDLVAFAPNGNWIGHNQSGSPGTLVGTNASSYGLNASGDTGSGDYVSAGDINNDRFPDFFFHYNGGRLFLSNGSGNYTSNAHGISVVTNTSKRIGSAWADYDNDGDLDLFVPRYDAGSTGYLWRDDVDWTAGTGNFTNVAASAGIGDTSGQRSCCWGDYDNDGYLDLYVVNRSGKNQLYHNNGDGTFTHVNEGTYIGAGCHDAVFVDYDNDGDLDLAITQESGQTILLENRTNNTNYLKVRVTGRGAGGTNKAGIGTRVELWNSAGTVRLGRRDVGMARGFGGSEPLWMHFGGVTPTTTYKLKTYLISRAANDPLVTTVVPSSVSTTIGSRTISQMITITDDAKSKIIQWSEVRNKAP